MDNRNKQNDPKEYSRVKVLARRDHEGYLTLIIVLGILLALVTVGLATKVNQIKPITIEQIVEEGLK